MLAGVVLAGGASRRMGRDKATMPVPGAAGRTMVEVVVDTVAQRCDPVFVVGAPGQQLPELPNILRDEVRGVGPLLATGRGLRAAASAGADWAFVCACDMPQMTTELIDQLSGRLEEQQADVVLPWDGRDHYLAALYRTTLADRVDELIAQGERSMRALVDRVDAQRIVLAPSPALINVNTLVSS